MVVEMTNQKAREKALNEAIGRIQQHLYDTRIDTDYDCLYCTLMRISDECLDFFTSEKQ